MSAPAQFYFGVPLREAKAKAASDERQACVAEILAYADTLPDASAAPYRHAAQLLGTADPAGGET